MKTTGKIWEDKEDFKSYLEQINGDGLFLKVQLVVGAILFLFFLGFLLVNG